MNVLDKIIITVAYRYRKHPFMYGYLSHLMTKGKLPNKECYWSINHGDAGTLAHKAAIVGMLPDDFDFWYISDDNGWSVGHTAAFFGNLPEKYNRYDLETFDGLSIRAVSKYYHSTSSYIDDNKRRFTYDGRWISDVLVN